MYLPRCVSLTGLIGIGFVVASCMRGEPPKPGTEYCSVTSDYATPDDCATFEQQAALQRDGMASFNAPNPMRRGETVAVWLAVADQPERPRPVPSPSSDQCDGKPCPTPSSTPTPTPTQATATEKPADPPPDPVAAATPVDPEPALAPSPDQIVEAMPGRTVKFSAIVGPRMAAELTGDDGFRIEPAQGDQQHKILRMGPPYASALWKWNVTALRGGVHTLAMRTVVEAVDGRGGFHELASTPATFSFTVQVTPWQQFWDGVEDAPKRIDSLTGLIVALTAFATAVAGLWAVLRRRRARRAAAEDSRPDTSNGG